MEKSCYGPMSGFGKAFHEQRWSSWIPPEMRPTKIHCPRPPSARVCASPYYPCKLGPDGSMDKRVVWVTKHYSPLDMRATAPVPNHKLVVPHVSLNTMPAPDDTWVPGWIHPRDSRDYNPRMHQRTVEERTIREEHGNDWTTRCRAWSTLREMLPSSGRPLRPPQPNWGAEPGNPPCMVQTRQSSFPVIRSSMSKYIDDMILSTRTFTYP